MAALVTDPIPCDIEHVDEYHEAPAVAVGKEGDMAFIDIYGLDNTVVLYFGPKELGQLIDALEDVETEICEGGDDGDTDSGGECVKYTGVDHLAGVSTDSSN